AGGALCAHPRSRANRTVRLPRAGGAVVVPDDRHGTGQASHAVRPCNRCLRRRIMGRLGCLPAGWRPLAFPRGATVQASLGQPDRDRAAGGHKVSPPSLSLTDVTKNFGPTEIIRGVSMKVAGGERHALIGPNGAGKTTLFN